VKAVEDYVGRLPSGKRKAFLKVVGILLGGLSLDVFLEKCRNEDFVVDRVKFLVDRLKEEGLSPKTISGFYMVYVKKFFKLCRVDVDWDIVRLRVDIPKAVNVKIDRAPTISELRRIILSVKSPRLKILIWFLAVTGLRIGEALSLKVENLDLESEPPKVILLGEKTFQKREVFLTREIAEELKKYLAGRKTGYLFPNEKDLNRKPNYRNIYDAFMKVLRRLGLDRRDPSGRGHTLHIHCLRKFYKSRLEELGVNPLFIEKWMGHVSDVVHAYFKPSRRLELDEWRKAEKALTIFSSEDEDVENVKKIQELENEISELKRILKTVLSRLGELHSNEFSSKHL